MSAGVSPRFSRRHDVGAAPAWIGVDRLSIGEHDDQQNGGDDERDRAGRAKRRGAGQHQHAQDFFGGVGHRRERVGREDREADWPRQPLVVGELRRDRLADDQPLDLCAERPFFEHQGLQSPTGLADGLEVGSPLAAARFCAAAFAPWRIIVIRPSGSPARPHSGRLGMSKSLWYTRTQRVRTFSGSD